MTGTGTSGDGDDARRTVLIAAGTENYDDAALAHLDRVPAALGTVVGSFRSLGVSPAEWVAAAHAEGFLLDMDVADFLSALERLTLTGDGAIVYYTGHGVKSTHAAFEAPTKRSVDGNRTSTAIRASDVVQALAVRDAVMSAQPPVLVIFDCCSSKDAGIDALSEVLRGVGNPKVWVMASATDYAMQGAFAAALKDALDHPHTGASAPFLKVYSVYEQVNDALGGTVSLFIGGNAADPQLIPNPRFQVATRGMTVAEQQTWGQAPAPSGAEGPEVSAGAPPEGETDVPAPAPPESETDVPAPAPPEGETDVPAPAPPEAPASPAVAEAGYLSARTGRRRAVDRIAGWLADPAQPAFALITGEAGTGKSRLLGLPGDATDPVRRAVLEAAAVAEPEGLAAYALQALHHATARTSVIAARGLTIDEVAVRIARILGRPERTAAELGATLGLPGVAPDATRVVVVDGLEESADPDALVGFLRRLTGVRVLAGARPHIAVKAADAVIVDLGAPEFSDPEALIAFVRRLLVAAHEQVPSPYPTDSPTVDAVAAVLARQATKTRVDGGTSESFFAARELALALRSRPEPVDTSIEGWETALPDSIGDAIDEELDALGDGAPVARTLLTALAWARGTGLPWEYVWAPVANAIAEADGVTAGLGVDNADVSWLLEHCGRYVIEDGGPGGTSVFRPFHDVLTRHLQRRPSDGSTDEAAADEWAARSDRVNAAIARTILATVPVADDHRSWRQAHAYVLTHLADHAAADPALFGELLVDLGYLANANPARLAPRLPLEGELAAIGHAYRRARPGFGDDPSGNLAVLLEAFDAENVGIDVVLPAIPPTYETIAAVRHPDESLQAIPVPGWTLGAAAIGLIGEAGSEPRLLLISQAVNSVAEIDLTGTLLNMWQAAVDISTATAITWGTDAASRLRTAFVLGDGTLRLIDGDEPGAGPAWPVDPARGEITAIAIVAEGDGFVLALGDEHGGISLQRSTDAAIPAAWAAHDGPVLSLGFPLATAPTRLLSGGLDGLRVHDLATGDLVEHVETDGPVGAVAGLLPDDDQPMSVIYAEGADLRLRELGQPFDPANVLVGHPLPVKIITVAFSPDAIGGYVLASADPQSIRVWSDFASAVTPEPAHRSAVLGVRFTVGDDGDAELVTVGADGDLRRWESGGAAIGEAESRHDGPIFIATTGLDGDGTPLLATWGADAVMRVRVGDEERTWLHEVDGIPTPDPCLAFVSFRGTPALVAAFGGSWRVWDLRGTLLDSAEYAEVGDQYWPRSAVGEQRDGNLVLATSGAEGVTLQSTDGSAQVVPADDRLGIMTPVAISGARADRPAMLAMLTAGQAVVRDLESGAEHRFAYGADFARLVRFIDLPDGAPGLVVADTVVRVFALDGRPLATIGRAVPPEILDTIPASALWSDGSPTGLVVAAGDADGFSILEVELPTETAAGPSALSDPPDPPPAT